MTRNEIAGICQWMQTQCSDMTAEIRLMADHPGSGKVLDELASMKLKLQTIVDATKGDTAKV